MTAFTADVPVLTGVSSTVGTLAGQSGSTATDLSNLMLDALSFGQIGSGVGMVNTSLQTSLGQALGKVSAVLQNVGQAVGTSAAGYTSADQAVATSLDSDGDAFIDHFATSHAQGASGSEVKEFQQELRQLGYDPGAADGQWGPATQKALAAYQAQHHYVTDAGSGTSIDLPGQLGTVQAPNPQAAAAVRSALSQTGLAYQWGGKTPASGLDCSGLTKWAYGQAGVTIPDGSGNQAVGQSVSQSDLAPGDLAVWKGHVAMYIGENKMVEAPQTGEHVHITPLRTTTGHDQFLGFYRPTTK